MFPFKDNINSYIKAVEANCVHAITAGGAIDGVKQTGQTIDRLEYGSGSLIVSLTATLEASETAKITVEEQQSADGSTWDTATALIAETTYLTGESGGSTDTEISQTAINYAGKKRYVRYNVTCTLSNSTTDTAAFSTLLVKGGAREQPAS